MKIQTQNFEITLWPDENRGYFEHDREGEHRAGGLWFDDKELIDYDGVVALPREVADALIEAGYDVDVEACCI